MSYQSRRTVGTVIAAVLALLGIVDIPEQVQRWQVWLSRVNTFLTTPGGRLTLVGAGLLIGLWAWDVHWKIIAKVKPAWLPTLRLQSGESTTELTTPIDHRIGNAEERIVHLENAVVKLIDRTQEDATSRQIKQLLVERALTPRIHVARYGLEPAPGKSADVLEAVVRNIKGGKLEMLADNHTLGVHPFHNAKKTLFIDYSYADHRRRIKIPESHFLVLPEPPEAAARADEW